MHRFRKQIAFIFGAIALFTYLSIAYYPEKKVSAPVVSLKEENTYMQIYLKDTSNTLVPLSIPINQEHSEEDKLQLLFAYMSGKQHIKGFEPLFTKECAPLKIMKKDKMVSLYFDDTFKNYHKDDELRVLEAITWGASQFRDIEQIQLYLNNVLLTKMPITHTPIPTILTRCIGINNFENATSSLHLSTPLTVFYTKNVSGVTYMVPKTKRVVLEGDSMQSSITNILADISSSTDLKAPLSIENISVSDANIKDGTISLELNKNILASNQSVKQDVYDSLVLSLGMLPNVENIEVKVKGVVVSPQSTKKGSQSVYNLLYNEVIF